METRLLGVADGPTTASLKQRLLGGKNFQAMILLPDARGRNSPLLDPHTVSVKWCGAPRPAYVYYRVPALALVFALLDADTLIANPAGNLEVTAALVSADKQSVHEVFPLQFSAAEIEQLRLAQESLSGRPIKVLNQSGDGVAGAFVFGQRRSDILTRTDAAGAATLDVPSRSSSPTHHAWHPEYFAARFDPLTSTTITLTARRDAATTFTITARPVAPDGAAVRDAILIVNYVDYYVWPTNDVVRISAPRDRDVQLTILAAGFAPTAIKLSAALTAEKIVLEPGEAEHNK
jgi:hypothetical protein